MANGGDVYSNAFGRGLLPAPEMTVSEWADRYRVLTTRASAEPGPWRTARVPYMREPMDAMSESSSVEKVVLMAGAQVAKTEIINNFLGYSIHIAPAPFLYVQPTMDMAKRASRQRIEPMIEECPILRSRVREARERDSGNTTLMKLFAGGILVCTGANSAVGLRQMPAKKLGLDEVDSYPGDVDGEGDPVLLAERALRTFPRSKEILTSTATIAGRSRIETAYNATDRSRYFLPCPFCEFFQVLTWALIKWDEDDATSAHMECSQCHKSIDERAKTHMLPAGQWRAEVPELSARWRGFHIPALLSPYGWFSWQQAVEMFLGARGKPEMLRTFVNTVLGETWTEASSPPEPERLYLRRESYKQGTIPLGGVLLTAGADLQADRIELEVVAWGRNLESWSVAYHVLPGDPAGEQVWELLDQILGATFEHEGGAKLSLRALAIDSGYLPQPVYEFARRHGPDRVYATKGMDRMPTMVAPPSVTEVRKSGARRRRGVKLWPVGVSLAKSELYGWLRADEPTDPAKEGWPRGWCHFPQDYQLEYFKQLASEQLAARIVKGTGGYPQRRYMWEKIRERNEALDCRVLARAAAAILGLDRWTPQDWAIAEAATGGLRAPTRRDEVRPGEPTRRPPKPRPRAPRGRGWLDGGGPSF